MLLKEAAEVRRNTLAEVERLLAAMLNEWIGAEKSAEGRDALISRHRKLATSACLVAVKALPR